MSDTPKLTPDQSGVRGRSEPFHLPFGCSDKNHLLYMVIFDS